MRSLHLRDVPDEVIERLERLAAREATSVNTLAVRELTAASRRAENPAALAHLPDLGVATDDVVAGLDTDRAER